MTGDITMLLNAIDTEDPRTAAELVPLVHDALDELTAEDPVKADVVKLKFFVGLTSEEIAARKGNSVTITRFPCSTGPTLDGRQREILTSRIAHDA